MSNLYLYEQKSKVSREDNRIIIETPDGMTRSIPIETLDSVVLYGQINLTTAVIHTLLEKGIPMTWLSKRGYFFGRLESTSHINIERQRLQFKKSDDEKFSLEIAKKFIYGKASNEKTLLLRYRKKFKIKNKECYDQLDKIILDINPMIEKIAVAESIESLRGIEGYITKKYYRGLNIVLEDEFKFDKRSKRPPKDEFNALLSYGYTLLLYEIFTTVSTKGLSPYAAFMHKDKDKHPALCSDLMEEFRPILVDSLAIKTVNNKMIKIEDFDRSEETKGVYLNKNGCGIFTNEFEKRLS